MVKPRRARYSPAYVFAMARLPLLLVGVALVMVAALVGIDAADRSAQVTAAAPTYSRSFDSGRSGTRTPLPETPTPTPTPTPTVTPSRSPTPSRTPSRTTTRPAPTKAATKTTAVAKSTPKPAITTTAASGGGSCPTLQGGGGAGAKRLHQALCARFPSVRTYYGYRPEAGSYHGTGQAIDAMVYSDSATGQAIADWARANAAEYGITQVIWARKIWTTQRASEGWRAMSDRGSITANHFDHAHLSVR